MHGVNSVGGPNPPHGKDGGQMGLNDLGSPVREARIHEILKTDLSNFSNLLSSATPPG